MKLNLKALHQHLAKPGQAVPIYLVYGPDSGNVEATTQRLITHFAGETPDPFALVSLHENDLKANPSRLMEEAFAQSMFGPPPTLVVRDANDGITTMVKDYLQEAEAATQPPNTLILRAQDLSTRSSLRKLVEGSKQYGAAVGCYADTPQEQSAILRDIFRQHGWDTDSQVIAYLQQRLPADRGAMLKELEKLALYAQDQSTLTIDDIDDVMGDVADATLDMVCTAVAGKSRHALFRALDRLFQEDVTFVAIFRSVARYFDRLLQARVLMDGGMSADAAMKTLKPPVFFKQAPAFRQHLSVWSTWSLIAARRKLMEGEARCKQTGTPQQTLCSRVLFEIASARTTTPPAPAKETAYEYAAV